MLADLIAIGLMAATGIYGALADQARRPGKGLMHGNTADSKAALSRAWDLEARHV